MLVNRAPRAVRRAEARRAYIKAAWYWARHQYRYALRELAYLVSVRGAIYRGW